MTYVFVLKRVSFAEKDTSGTNIELYTRNDREVYTAVVLPYRTIITRDLFFRAKGKPAESSRARASPVIIF